MRKLSNVRRPTLLLRRIGVRVGLACLSILSLTISLTAEAGTCLGYGYFGPLAQTSLDLGFSGGQHYFNVECEPSSYQNQVIGAPGFDLYSGVAAGGIARADLATGEVGAFAFVETSQFKFAVANVTAMLRDDITFNIPFASDNPSDPNYRTTVGLSVLLDGTFDSPSTSYYGVSLIGRDGLHDRLFRTTQFSGAGDAADGVETQKFGDWSPDQVSGSYLLWQGDITVVGTRPTVSIETNLQVTAQAPGGVMQWQTYYSDFLYTAAVDFILPANVTFTSQSGVFLTSVPEPTTLALLGLGLAGLGFSRRKQ